VLVGRKPRDEKPLEVIAKRKTDLPGLSGADLSKNQQTKLLETMRRMLACFRPDDVAATMKTIEDKNWSSSSLSRATAAPLTLATTRYVEGPEMVWYFRGVPHFDGYFHLAA
jgi:hypothetical protein